MSDLEDAYEDIIGKAMRGLDVKPIELMQTSGLSMLAIESALKGEFEENSATAIAASLGLHPSSLIRIGRGDDYSPPTELPAGLAQFTTPAPVPGYEEMTVNSYLIWKPGTPSALLFDVGTDITPIVDFCQKEKLTVEKVFFTHSHPDHIEALADAKKVFSDAAFYCPQDELVQQCQPVANSDVIDCGELQVEARSTPGHSPGGTTYLVSGLGFPVAVVGDAIFAGSIGGVATNFYQDALSAIRSVILTQPDETLILPGHKRVTTVGVESKNNPFLAVEN